MNYMQQENLFFLIQHNYIITPLTNSCKFKLRYIVQHFYRFYFHYCKKIEKECITLCIYKKRNHQSILSTSEVGYCLSSCVNNWSSKFYVVTQPHCQSQQEHQQFEKLGTISLMTENIHMFIYIFQKYNIIHY